MQHHPDWRIDYVRLRDRSSYFESETQSEYRVVHLLSGKLFKKFYCDEFANSSGEYHDGVEEIRFSPNGQDLFVKYFGGRAEIFRLPRW